jgi:hypothetical protein
MVSTSCRSLQFHLPTTSIQILRLLLDSREQLIQLQKALVESV